MKKILVFSGSNSSASINRQLAKYIGEQIEGQSITYLDLRDYPLPLFSLDIEKADGIPENAQKLKALFEEHDAFVLSIPEHNASMPAFFKNTIDWISRIEMKFLGGKPIALFGASPGRSATASSRANAERTLSRSLGGNVIGSLGLPSFRHNTEVQDDGSLVVTDEAFVQDMKLILENLLSEEVNSAEA